MGSFTICLTHDVDRVYKSYQYLTQDIFKMKIHKLNTLFLKENPYWCFDRIMNLEEKYSVRSTFFFLEETMKANMFFPKTWKLSFGRYSFNDHNIIKIINTLNNQGWEIGLHGSYNSYMNKELLKKEKLHLEEVIGKSIDGIRQHYLNLKIPETWEIQKEVGFKYDASFGKKRGIGNIEGFDKPFKDKDSGIFVIPLTIMEFNLIREAGNNINNAKEIVNKYINSAIKNNSVLTILWHQRFFNEKEFPGYSHLYEHIIKESQLKGGIFKKCIDLYQETERDE